MIVSGGSIERESTSVWRGHFSWPTLVVVLLDAGSIGFNIGWYRHDIRPVADPNTIGARMAREPYVRAGSAFPDHLRQAAHDGEARTLLAQALAARGDVYGRDLQQNSQATLE